MINIIPQNWEYSNNVEMLFLFYQCADELLSENTTDTYSLPLHNAMTLSYEIRDMFQLLKDYNIVSKYYNNYIPIIIDEFLDSLQNDNLLKKELGSRLNNITTGFTEAKNNYVLLERWIDSLHQICDLEKYRIIYLNEITRLVKETKDKNDLITCTKVYFSTLQHLGYSREYMYVSVKRFFNNKNKVINSPNQISEFLSIFDCSKKEHNFLVLIDLYTIEYIISINDQLSLSQDIKKVDVVKERNSLSKDYNVSELLKEYDKLLERQGDHQKIAVIELKSSSLDPYRAIEELEELIKFMQSFSIYFKHYRLQKQIFKILLKKENDYYIVIKPANKLMKRPYVEQEIIDRRICNIIFAKSMSRKAFYTLASAINMHSEAFNSDSIKALIINFWGSLETLFLNPVVGEGRDNVINSTLHIVQKTYMLKILRTVYFQLTEATEKNTLKELGIANFNDFICYYSSYDEKSDQMKKIYTLLSSNPLLRSRLYSLRQSIGSGDKIAQLIKNHEIKIRWQLHRLYRTRNILTHIGINPPYSSEIIVNHLHNYFDFVVNYILCKSENGNYVASISSVVFEAKNDNTIHLELLKSKEPLSKENYMDYLFGPDKNLISYIFEY